MNASCFRLSRTLIAAALLTGSTGALAQAAKDSPPEARAPGAGVEAPAAESQRERGRRRNKDGPTATKSAAEPTAAPFPAQPASKAADSDLICKYDALPGTKVKRKVCGTAEQWAAWRKKNEDSVAEVTRKTRENAGLITRPDLATRSMPPGGGASP